VATPFVPLNDPSNVYTILVGFFINGRALIAVNSQAANLAVTTSTFSPQYGQLIQLDPKTVPGTFKTEVAMNRGVRYNVMINGLNFVALEWNPAQSGPLFTFYGLNDAPIASAIATTTGLPFLAVAGGVSGESIGVEAITETGTGVVVGIIGSTAMTVNQLNGGQYGFQPLMLLSDAEQIGGQYQITSDLAGGWPYVTVTWQIPRGIANYTIAINGFTGYQLLNSTNSPIDQRYGLQKAYPSTGTAFVRFLPRGPGQYEITITGKGFGGSYVGTIAVTAYDNGLRTSLPAGAGTVAFMLVVGYFLVRRRSTGIRTEPMLPGPGV